jgi:hypothetical protein
LVQLYRSAGEAGLFRVLFLVIFLVPLLSVFLYQRIGVHPWPLIIPAGAVYLVWLIHSRRKDYRFLVSVNGHPARVFASEYLLFTLPLSILLLLHLHFIPAAAFVALMALVSVAVPISVTKSAPPFRLRLIPAGMFEWQGGIRQNLVALILFYFPGLLGFWHPAFAAVSAILVTLVFISFYSEYEPVNMLGATNLKAGKFIPDKVTRHVGWFALILLPLLLATLIHPGYRLVSMGYYIAALNLLAFSILLKYYQYRPGAYSGAHQLLCTLAGLISVILPVALLVFIFNIFLGIGAISNLKNYLNDRN